MACSTLAENNKFYDFSVKDVVELISNDDLNVSNERLVFDFIMRWVKYDADKRKSFLPSLLEYVKFPYISKEDLINISLEPLFQEHLKCQRFIIQAQNYMLKKSTSFLSGSKIIPRKSYLLVKSVYAIGGKMFDGSAGLQCVECFDFRHEKWRIVSFLPVTCSNAAAVVVDDYIYVKTCLYGWRAYLRLRRLD